MAILFCKMEEQIGLSFAYHGLVISAQFSGNNLDSKYIRHVFSFELNTQDSEPESEGSPRRTRSFS
jgi:hypothetical protein